MKGQDTTPEKQLNEMETGNYSEKKKKRKKIQNNDVEDDPGSWKQNGEEARNVY